MAELYLQFSVSVLRHKQHGIISIFKYIIQFRQGTQISLQYTKLGQYHQSPEQHCDQYLQHQTEHH